MNPERPVEGVPRPHHEGDRAQRPRIGVEAPSKKRRAAWILIVLALVAVVFLGLHEAFDRETLTQIAHFLRGFGDRWWAPAALIGAFAVVNLVGLPGTPLTLAAGVVWGWLPGGLWVMAAIMIGTTPPYLIARKGFPQTRRRLQERSRGLSGKIAQEGPTALLVMRLTHLVPFAVLNYAAGLANLRARAFYGATFLGTLPGVFIHTYLADAILGGIVAPEEASGQVLLAGILLATLVVVSRWLARRFNGRAGS
jgi:uncharacterized membrane protein YdjX (TVP38/TMEM64 family)